MQHKSKLEESIKLLRSIGWKVQSLPSGKYEAYLGTTAPQYDKYHIYTVRELIKLANTYTKNSNQTTAIKKGTKEESKCERAFVRDELRKYREDADTNYPKTKFADRWNWD